MVQWQSKTTLDPEKQEVVHPEDISLMVKTSLAEVSKLQLSDVPNVR